MIEPKKFQERVIHKTPHGGTYSIASFYDGKTNMPCEREVSNVWIITEYNDKDEVIHSNRMYRGDGIKYSSIPGFLLKRK